MRNVEEERLDREQEAAYWRAYKGNKGNCLFVLLALVAGLTLPVWAWLA